MTTKCPTDKGIIFNKVCAKPLPRDAQVGGRGRTDFTAEGSGR